MARRLLVTPRQFFEDRDELNGVVGAGVALVVSLVMTTVVGVALWLFSRQLGGTATVDNPDRPPQGACESPAGLTPAGCDQPAQITVEVSALFWQAASGALPFVFVGLLVVWFLLGVGLFLGAKVSGGTGSFGATLEVTAWGLVPTLVTALVGSAGLVVYGLQADLAVGSLQELGSRIEPLQAGLSGLALLLVQTGGAAWQAFVWAAGLRVVHGITRFAALAVAIIVAIVPVVLG